MGEWTPFDWTHLSSVLFEPGVFEITDDEGTTIYIGSSKNVRLALEQHLRRYRSRVRELGKSFRVEYCKDYKHQETLMMHLHRDAFGQEPVCNILLVAK